MAEQAQEEESRLSAELERTARQLEHSEIRVEEAEQQLIEQKNSARQANAERDKMHHELTCVLEAIARGDTDEVRRRHVAGESFLPTQPDWLGPQPDDGSTAGASAAKTVPSAWMDDRRGTAADRARDRRSQWRQGSDRSRSPSLLSDDGETADSVASSSTAGSRETCESLNIEQALQTSRQRAAESMRQQQHVDLSSNRDTLREENSVGKDEVAFMAMAAAREVQATQERMDKKAKSAGGHSVDVRQARTPVTSAVRSREAANASAARRRNKRVKQKQKMARLSAMEAGV